MALTGYRGLQVEVKNLLNREYLAHEEVALTKDAGIKD